MPEVEPVMDGEGKSMDDPEPETFLSPREEPRGEVGVELEVVGAVKGSGRARARSWCRRIRIAAVIAKVVRTTPW